jgi:asparagine synthase (glutamine-hydrolysing)
MFAKIPRAMRFADRVSMMHSRELREPFLDHRILELGLVQPAINKIRNGVRKYLVRQAGKGLINHAVLEASKRPVQTPQREWLKNELKSWTTDHIENVLSSEVRIWLDAEKVRSFWKHYQQHDVDNSFPVWQLISLSLILETK